MYELPAWKVYIEEVIGSEAKKQRVFYDVVKAVNILLQRLAWVKDAVCVQSGIP